MPRLSDPRRLPSHNHYQEGPGFLCVATHGGRPPTGGPVERIANVVRRRRAAVRRLEFWSWQPKRSRAATLSLSSASSGPLTSLEAVATAPSKEC